MKLELIQELANRLKNLVDDPQEGLISWNLSLHDVMTELTTEWNTISKQSVEESESDNYSNIK